MNEILEIIGKVMQSAMILIFIYLCGYDRGRQRGRSEGRDVMARDLRELYRDIYVKGVEDGADKVRAIIGRPNDGK